MYNGVPTELYIYNLLFEFFFAKPKSPILAWFFDNIMLAGFKSLNKSMIYLWTIPYLTKDKNPLQIYLRNRIA